MQHPNIGIIVRHINDARERILTIIAETIEGRPVTVEDAKNFTLKKGPGLLAFERVYYKDVFIGTMHIEHTAYGSGSAGIDVRFQEPKDSDWDVRPPILGSLIVRVNKKRDFLN